jgi:diguanylate cyclase (GGDEF)-like protein
MCNANPDIRHNMTQQHTSETGIREKRRHARKATLQAVQLRFGEAAAIPAEIRDYCQTGLYVAFPAGRTPDAAISALVGTLVGAGFSVDQGDATRSYLLNGWVARVAPGGVGIFVPAMPETALQALRAASARLALPGAQAGPDLGPQQAQALQQECTGLFRNFLDAVMQEFFLQSMERLAQAGQDEMSFLERARYEYGAQELMQHRSRIEDDFFNAIRERIQHVGPVSDMDRVASGANTLTLVDEAEFEDWLNLSAVIKQIEADITPQLNEFEQRYSRLVGAPIDRKSNPFGPEMIGRAFQGAIQGLDFTNPMRTVLYKGLGRAVSSHGPALYRQLNQTLASLQPLAPARHQDKPRPAAAESGAAAVDSTKAKPDLAEIAETLNRLYKQDQASHGQMPESAEYSLDRILSTLNQSQRRPAGRAPTGASATRSRPQGDLPAGHAVASSEVLSMVGRLQQTARQLVGHDGQTPPTRGTAMPEASLHELLAALEGLPLPNQTAVAGSPTPASLAELVDVRIASTAGDGKRLAPAHRQILDTTSALFNQARADFVPSSEVELLVKRLERPLLKLALQDTDFPSIPDHPARQVLNLIEQYAVAADDKGKFFDAKLQRFLYLLVDRVCSRADEDPGVFEMVRDSLEKVLLPILQIRRTRVARLQEASEGRERIRAARSRVNAALEARLAGREVPAMLLRLLDAGWRQYLVLLEMRHGSHSEAWEAGLVVLDKVFDCLGPNPAADSGCAESGLVLQREIERALATINVDANMLASFMDELGASLTAGPPAPATASAMVFVPPGKLATAQGKRETPAHARLAERLRVGDWWDFSLEGNRVPMQLIWVSEPPASCAFANRSATSKLEFTLAELSRQLQNDLAKPGKDLDLPLMERSEQALFDETYQSLVHQANHDPVSGLLNRKGFMQRLHAQTGPDEADKTHVVGVIEFDQFRLIHNTCGEDAVERLTRSLTEEIRKRIGPEAAVALFHEDTLALLLPNCSRIAGCPAVATLLEGVKDYHFQHEQHSYRIGFNIGLSEYDPVRISAVEAIRRADSACITAKAQGRNRMQAYEQDSPQLQNQESLMDWAGRLDSVLQGSGLYLRCQKVMPIGTDLAVLPYYEILLGIDGEEGLEINPSHFIPAVEQLQRSHEVDIWVLRKVFAWIGANPAIFSSVGGFAINLSATSLSSPEVARYLQNVLAAGDFPTDKIIFEITESAAIESYGAAQDFIREMRRHGCKFSLDDFGSGYTSYAHLKNLRTDTLKIDGSFVKDMLLNPSDYAMVKSMNDIGHSLGMQTVAEYVESSEILDALREVGVDYAQGYAVHKPCRIDDILLAQAS